MTYTVLYGEDVDVPFLDRLVAVDHACYEPAYWGDPANTVARYERNRRSFVFVVDDESGRLAGYVNFFPCELGLHQDNVSRSPVIRDDDIAPDEVAQYRTDENHLFVLSIAVHPAYQDGEVIRLLTDGFVGYLRRLRDEGLPVTSVVATAVSGDGTKVLRSLLFHELRHLEDGNTVFVCDGPRLDRLLAGRAHFATYRSDLWLLLPLAEHEANLRVDNLLEDRARGVPAEPATADDRALAEHVISELVEYLSYECSNEVVRDLELAHLGSFDFLHTTDDYPARDAGEEIVMGTARGHAVLVCHRRTHMFVLAVLLSAYPFSVTQMEDQVSYDYLKIRSPEGPDRFVSLYDYLLETFGLHRCGRAKCALFLSERPDNDRELQDMLAAETYDNYGREYRIDSTEVRAMSLDNRAQFDDYELYLSSRAVVYVAKSFCELPMDRVSDFANYLFIVVLVLFQNTALEKVNTRVTRVLEANHDISPKAKLAIDREYGRTVRFWETQNFKYLSSQIEATCLREAFLNQELHDVYTEHQEYLEHLVSVKSAIVEGRTGMVINVAAVILAIIQLQPFFADLLRDVYEGLGIEATYAETTTYCGLFGGVAIYVLVVVINQRRRRHQQRSRI